MASPGWMPTDVSVYGEFRGELKLGQCLVEFGLDMEEDVAQALALANKKDGAERVARPGQGPESPRAPHPAPPKKVMR